MQIADLVSVVTSVGVLGTLLLGFVNLYSLRKSEKHTQKHSLNVGDYEKRRDFVLVTLIEYIQLLDAHELSYMALTDEEYKGQDLVTYKKLYSLETLYYKIRLMINVDNLYCNDFLLALDTSMSLAKTIRSENLLAEMISNGLRTPERALEISEKVLANSKKMRANTGDATYTIDIEADEKEKLDIIAEAMGSRDMSLKNYLTAAQDLTVQKEALVIVAQKYLAKEKAQLLNENG